MNSQDKNGDDARKLTGLFSPSLATAALPIERFFQKLLGFFEFVFCDETQARHPPSFRFLMTLFVGHGGKRERKKGNERKTTCDHEMEKPKWGTDERKALWTTLVTTKSTEVIYEVVSSIQPQLFAKWTTQSTVMTPSSASTATTAAGAAASTTVTTKKATPPMIEIDLAELEPKSLDAILEIVNTKIRRSLEQHQAAMATMAMTETPAAAPAVMTTTVKRMRTETNQEERKRREEEEEKEEEEATKQERLVRKLGLDGPGTEEDPVFPITVIVYDAKRQNETSKPFVCSFPGCFKSFSDRSNLVNHFRFSSTHTTFSPFTPFAFSHSAPKTKETHARETVQVFCVQQGVQSQGDTP